jgi:hypothetical protein
MSTTGAGAYSADIALDPTLDAGPAVAISLRVEDLWVWPLVALLAGVGTAWLATRYRDEVRPRNLLTHHLADAGERYLEGRDKTCTTDRDRQRTRGLFVPAGPSRAPLLRRGRVRLRIDGPTPGEKAYTAVRRAKSAEELTRARERVEDIVTLVDSWLALCPHASELQGLVDRHSRRPAEDPAVVERARALLEPSPLTSGKEAAALLGDVRAQIEAIKMYGEVQKLYLGVRATWNLLGDSDQAELQRYDPEVIWRTARSQLDTKMEWVDGPTTPRLLKAYEAVLARLENPASTYSYGASDAVRSVIADVGQTVGQVVERARTTQVPRLLRAMIQPETEVEERSASQILSTVRTLDMLDFLVAAGIATGAFFIALYAGKNFGTAWDYLAAFFAGAAGTLVITWALMPWYRKYGLGDATASNGATK